MGTSSFISFYLEIFRIKSPQEFRSCQNKLSIEKIPALGMPNICFVAVFIPNIRLEMDNMIINNITKSNVT